MTTPDLSNSHRRPGFPALVPCIRVQRARGLLEFMKNGLGAEIVDETMDEESRVAYAAVRFAEGGFVEVSEASERFGVETAAIHLYVPHVDRVHRRACAAGAVELYPPSQMPYGERSSGVADPHGNHWYLASFTGG